MAGLSPEKLDEVKERLLDRKRRLWQEVKQQLKSNIGDGYQEMLAAAGDERGPGHRQSHGRNQSHPLGTETAGTGGHRGGHEPDRERQLRVL